MNEQIIKRGKQLVGLLRAVIILTLIGAVGNLIRPDGSLGNAWIIVLSLIGAAFLVWGSWKSRVGEILLGSIVSAVAATVILLNGPLGNVTEAQERSVLLLALGLGFGLTTLLTAFFTVKPRWWALAVGVLLVITATFMS